MPDPWAQFHLEDIKTEPCTRYRYFTLETSLMLPHDKYFQSFKVIQQLCSPGSIALHIFVRILKILVCTIFSSYLIKAPVGNFLLGYETD